MDIIETPIVFHSQGVPMAGRFLRTNASAADRRPAILVTGSWLTVKEQMALVYARRLAARGFIAFIFDFAGFGESGGHPRQTESPARKIIDIVAAAEFVSTFSFVAPGKIGHLAICASAQYGLAALAKNAPIASFASVAGWFHDAASIAPFYGDAEGMNMRLRHGTAAAQTYLSSGKEEFAPAYDPGNDRAGMFFQLPYYAHADRGAIPSWKNAMTEMSWQHWLAFDGLSAADHVTAPCLFVHGDGCALPSHVRQIHARVRGPKDLIWIDGNQIDFYDQPDHVDRAMAAVEPWFKRTLGAS